MKFQTCALPECNKEFEPYQNKMYCCDAHGRKHRHQKKTNVAEGQIIKASDKDLLQELHKRGYFASREPAETDERFTIDTKQLEGDKFTYAVVSDVHFGSKYQQLSALKSFYRYCADLGIKNFFNCGDLNDGNGKVYPGQIYEIFLHGADAQEDYAVEYYPKEEGCKTRIIGGNHDESFWKADGTNITKRVCARRDDMEYLGMLGAYIEIEGILIYLLHPRGGKAYALSYKLQKFIENFSPDNKPHILHCGHYHQAVDIPGYRNVAGFMQPCFQAQTPFLKSMGIQPFVAGLIVELTICEKGLARVKTEWVPFYFPTENDY